MFRKRAFSGLLAGALALATACTREDPVRVKEGNVYTVLQPMADPAAYTAKVRQLVYVPVYSSLYWGFEKQTTELSAMLSIRNVSTKYALIVHSVKYYDSGGNEIREYLQAPSTLAPMATADVVIQRRDRTGGPGANFLVEWSSAHDIDEPVIEAVMTGQHGSAGISFSTTGRVLPKASAELAPLTPSK